MGNENCTGRGTSASGDADLIAMRSELRNQENELSQMPSSLMNPYASDEMEGILQQPTQSFESFEKYVGHLNMLLNRNMPFLKAKFGVTTITIMTALADGGILTEGLKKKLFDKRLAKTTILV